MRRTFLPAPAIPPGRPRLVVTGFMGTGKTAAGRAASALLGLPFVDLDGVVERRAGATVAEIFEREGEAGFRRLECAAVLDAASLSGAVVATGGGAVLDRKTFGALAAGAEVAVLTCEPAELHRRLGHGAGRPLLHDGDRARIDELLRDRADRYGEAGVALDTTSIPPTRTAAILAERYRSAAPTDPLRVEIRTPNGTSTILIGDGALADLATAVRTALPDAHAALVAADASVAGSIAAGVAERLRAADLRVTTAEVPAGEGGKTLATVTALWDRMHAAGVGRTDAVVAVGGGATLDAVGFAAATYGRGIPLVNVPTTLLAMVDASLGGKVGLDHGDAKNLVGAFHHPRVVVTDPASLAGLPPGVLRHGLAETVKMAAAASPLVLDVMEAMPLDERDVPADLPWLIEQAVRVKAAYVEADPEDHGLRHSLNLGHTFAHAIESATSFRVAHGDAVAIGTVAAAHLGELHEVTPAGTADRLRALLVRLGLPVVAPAALDRGAMLEAIASDKKRRGGRAVFVVPAPNGVELLDGLDPAEALDALEIAP